MRNKPIFVSYEEKPNVISNQYFSNPEEAKKWIDEMWAKYHAAQQSVQADVCRYRWGEGMETGEHSYVNGVCGKCGKRR